MFLFSLAHSTRFIVYFKLGNHRLIFFVFLSLSLSELNKKNVHRHTNDYFLGHLLCLHHFSLKELRKKRNGSAFFVYIANGCTVGVADCNQLHQNILSYNFSRLSTTKKKCL